MPTSEYALFASAIAIGLLLGVPTALHSQRKDKIYGGSMTHLLHYLAAASFATLSLTIPLLLVGAVLRVHFTLFLPYLFALLAVMMASLLGFAVLEYFARSRLNMEVRAWSETDARTSGL